MVGHLLHPESESFIVLYCPAPKQDCRSRRSHQEHGRTPTANRWANALQHLATTLFVGQSASAPVACQTAKNKGFGAAESFPRPRTCNGLTAVPMRCIDLQTVNCQARYGLRGADLASRSALTLDSTLFAVLFVTAEVGGAALGSI
jgi:hypothetical protein